MRDHHTSQHSHVSLAGTDTKDCHLEQQPEAICFSTKIDVIFKNLLNVFGIADDILVVGYDIDGKDHNKTMQQVLQVCKQVNLKLNKAKCHFRCTLVPLFGVATSRHGVQPNP